MATEILESHQIIDQFIEQHPVDGKLVLHDVSWDEYEALMDQLVDPAGLRIAYDDGTLQIMTTSAEHEKYARLFEALITVVRLRKRMTIHSFGSATMRKRKKAKGNEPDACFYVQSAPLIGNRVDIDFEIDPPPDIAVEIDLHRDSISKFSIYAALGVGEVWRYDGEVLKIDLLEGADYIPANQSRTLPILTSEILTHFLRRMREDDNQALIEFDEWIQQQPA
jgi:Uma2 family endonuclease